MGGQGGAAVWTAVRAPCFRMYYRWGLLVFQFAQAFDYVPPGICVKDPSGNVVGLPVSGMKRNVDGMVVDFSCDAFAGC